MTQDIYTSKPIITDTEEHILLNALGGRRTCRGIIDVTTNSRFGKEIDNALADVMLPVRVLLALRDGDNKLPPPIKRVPGDDGVLYNLAPKGVPSLSTTRVGVSYPEPGRVRIEGTVHSLAELRRYLERTLAKHNIPFEHIAQQVQMSMAPAPPVTFSLEFDERCYRAIAKMACNLLAMGRPALFSQNNFDPIRSFVSAGGSPIPHVALSVETIDIDADGRALGPLDHLLLVRGDAKSGRVEALAALYKHIQFIVHLGTMDLDRDIAFAYRLDQDGRGERRGDQDPRDLTLHIPSFARAQERQVAMGEEALNRAMTALFTTVSALQGERRLTEIVRTSWDEAFAGEPEGTIITDEHFQRFARLASPHIVLSFFAGRGNNGGMRHNSGGA